MNSREYQQAINAWAKSNFTYMDKIGYGMVEEIGEYCHHLLKSKQSIRRHALKGGRRAASEAYNVQALLNSELKDCLGDGMIFTLHWAEVNETFISFEETEQYCLNFGDVTNEYEGIATLLQCLSTVFRLEHGENDLPPRTEAQRTFNNFALIAKIRGWSWQDILQETWEEISKRDWTRYSINGKDK